MALYSGISDGGSTLWVLPPSLAFHATFDTIFIAVGLISVLNGAITDLQGTVTVFEGVLQGQDYCVILR